MTQKVGYNSPVVQAHGWGAHSQGEVLGWGMYMTMHLQGSPGNQQISDLHVYVQTSLDCWLGKTGGRRRAETSHLSSNHILILFSNRSQPLACHVQADGSIGAGFIDAMLTESGGRSSAAATWEGALRSAFASVAALPLTELPASFGAKLRVLDVMLQAPALQQCLVRSFTLGSRLGLDIQQCHHAMHGHIGKASGFAPVLLVVCWSRL